MCELYGFSGSREKKLNGDLRTFYSHACGHPNGWGLALLDENAPEVIREVCRADRSEYLRNRLESPILARTALAHIRRATIGSEEFVNCHPFTAADSCGRQWILIHNGTVFESEHLNRYVFRQRGETDSERILLYIIDKINEASDIAKRPLTSGERFALLDKIVCGSSPKNKLNLLIYDGELLYAHTNFKDSLYEKLDHFGTTFSTCPLTGEGWQELPFTTLTAYHEGRRVFTGTNHQHEYFFDPSSYKPLFLAYSGL